MSDLWIIDTRTAEKRRLLEAGAHAIAGSGADAVQPSWSPGGKRIAFWGLGDQFSNRDIWTIEADAKEPVETLVRVTSDAHLDWSPTWSPRGDALYFGSDRDGTVNLWRIRIDEESGQVEGKPRAARVAGRIQRPFHRVRTGRDRICHGGGHRSPRSA